MIPCRRRLILARVLDPKYEHPKSMRLDLRIKRIYKRLYPDGTEEMVMRESPMLSMVKRG